MKILLEKRLGVMIPSDKLKMYGQLLLTSQRHYLRKKYSEAEDLRKDAEKILFHFETTLDGKKKYLNKK